MEKPDFDLAEIEETVVMKLTSDKATLPVETSSELTKGYALLNKLLYEVLQDKHIEHYTDEHGESRRRTHYHPWTLELLKERRRVIDQIWKMQGGEALNEARKAGAKKYAEKIWDMQDPEIKQQHKDKFIKVMEAKVDEERKE